MLHQPFENTELFSGTRMADVSDSLNRLLQVRNQLIRNLKEVDELIRSLQQVQNRMGSIEQSSTGLLSLVAPIGGVSQYKGSRAVGTPPADIADRVEKLLLDQRRPMTRSQIARALTAEGIVLAGQDVNKNVGTILWRNRDRFVNLKKLGYWLAAVDLPGIYKATTAND